MGAGCFDSGLRKFDCTLFESIRCTNSLSVRVASYIERRFACPPVLLVALRLGFTWLIVTRARRGAVWYNRQLEKRASGSRPLSDLPSLWNRSPIADEQQG
jgi:hypothetical protein